MGSSEFSEEWADVARRLDANGWKDAERCASGEIESFEPHDDWCLDEFASLALLAYRHEVAAALSAKDVEHLRGITNNDGGAMPQGTAQRLESFHLIGFNGVGSWLTDFGSEIVRTLDIPPSPVRRRPMTYAHAYPLLGALLGGTIPRTLLPGVLPRDSGSFVEDLEIDDEGCPSDRAVEGIETTGMHQARRWMHDQFALLAQSIPYSSVSLEEIDGERRIHYSTGGWSGGETFIRAVISNFSLNQYVAQRRSGGHYIIEVPRLVLRVPQEPQL